MYKLKVVSLFSGIGGFEAGLDLSGIDYELVFAAEIDENAKKSYLANYPVKNLYGDITKINEKDIPEHDLLVAGFPCQSFSIAGKRLGFEDTRGTLFFDVARILREKKPKYILLENVKNLVNHDKGNTIKVILNTLNEIGYTVDFDVINSTKVGLPQNRERTYIVGVFNHNTTPYIPLSSNKKVNSIKMDLNSKKFNSFDFFSKLTSSTESKHIKDILEFTEDEKYFITSREVERFLLENNIQDTSIEGDTIIKLFDLPKYVWNDLERQRRVYSINGISPTVLARSDSTKILIKDNNSDKCYIRKFTPRENFRAQGFSENFIDNIYNIGMSNTQMYKQSGNAVSPPVIARILGTLITLNKEKKSTFIDLFCGLGGFRIAFEKHDFNCVFSSDIDPYVREVYKDNFGDYPYGDITKIKGSDIPNHDILCAGFPCQPFSLAGKRLGFEDIRGTLFFDVARILKEKRPKFFILENVAGLENHDSGNTLRIIINTIEEIDYFFDYQILNAYEYGVPQNRKRWYGIGIRQDIHQKMLNKQLSFKFPEKRELLYTIADILEPVANSDYNVSSICKDNIDKKLGDFVKSSRYNSGYPLIATEIRPSRCNFRCDGISPCLTAKMGTGGNNVPVLVKEYRKLTEVECLKIMGFPSWYKIPKNKMQSYKQIGNSVIVPIIELFVIEIKRILKEIEYGK